MLEVESMALGYLSIDGFLDPDNLVNKFVAPFPDHLARMIILGIDDPDEDEPHLEEAWPHL